MNQETKKPVKSGFVLFKAYCTNCDYQQHRVSSQYLDPVPLKETIIERIQSEHLSGCETGLVIVINNCYYE